MSARSLTPEQVGALADAADPLYRPVVWAAALTGCRPGELRAARHDQVDLEKWRLKISYASRSAGPSKAMRGRWTTFPPSLQRMFVDAGGDLTGLLVDPAGKGVLSGRALTEVIRTAQARSGVRARWQDLRYTWVAWLQAGRVPEQFVANCAGWQRRSRNDHRSVDQDTHRHAIAALERIIDRA